MTAGTEEQQELVAELAAALDGLGLDGAADGGVLVVDGERVPVHVVARAHPTPADLMALTEAAASGLPVVVVADRISEPGRDVLRRAGWGWLDRRGHVRIWTRGLRIDAPLVATHGPPRSRAANPWTEVGLELAVALLLEPQETASARRLAARIGRSPGAVHELLARFTELGLVGPRTRLPLLPDLFWETAAHWPDDGWVPVPVPLAELAQRIGGAGLVRVDERAATLGGARIPAAGDLPARCYVRTAGGWRRARALFDGDAPARSWVRRSPVAWVPVNEAHPADDDHPWEVAHPLVCALRLAADPARGREVVDDWGIVPEPPP